MENEIEELKKENKKLEDDNKRLKKEYLNRFMRVIFKFIKLAILGFFGLVIFYLIDNFTEKYYIYKDKYPTKDCFESEKNYAIKESEAQKKIAELQKEICSLKSKTTETKKETSSSKTTKTQTTKNTADEKSPCENKSDLFKQ